MGFFSDLFGGGYEDAAQKKAQGLQLGYSQATDLYGQGRAALNEYYGKAAQPFQTVFEQAGPGAQLYADVTGAGGTAGQDRARALFQTDPGYQFARDEALKATER